jgi:osmoprotectant transport system substrate-binding protein
VVTEETAEDLGLEKISDLPADGAGLELGAPQDCETNPFCLPGLERVYGIDLSGGFTPLDAGLVADALAAGEVQVGVLFSTSGRIADEGWVLLEDDQAMLAADNVVPVLSDELVDAYGEELVELLDEISAAIDTATLTELNRRFDIDKDDADAIAEEFIADAGL